MWHQNGLWLKKSCLHHQPGTCPSAFPHFPAIEACTGVRFRLCLGHKSAKYFHQLCVNPQAEGVCKRHHPAQWVRSLAASCSKLALTPSAFGQHMFGPGCSLSMCQGTQQSFGDALWELESNPDQGLCLCRHAVCSVLRNLAHSVELSCSRLASRLGLRLAGSHQMLLVHAVTVAFKQPRKCCRIFVALFQHSQSTSQSLPGTRSASFWSNNDRPSAAVHRRSSCKCRATFNKCWMGGLIHNCQQSSVSSSQAQIVSSGCPLEAAYRFVLCSCSLAGHLHG